MARSFWGIGRPLHQQQHRSTTTTTTCTHVLHNGINLCPTKNLHAQVQTCRSSKNKRSKSSISSKNSSSSKDSSSSKCSSCSETSNNRAKHNIMLGPSAITRAARVPKCNSKRTRKCLLLRTRRSTRKSKSSKLGASAAAGARGRARATAAARARTRARARARARAQARAPLRAQNKNSISSKSKSKQPHAQSYHAAQSASTWDCSPNHAHHAHRQNRHQQSSFAWYAQQGCLRPDPEVACHSHTFHTW